MVDRTKGAAEKETITINSRKIAPLTLTQLKKKLDLVESEYKELRRTTEYDKANPGKHVELAALGKRVGDLHRALRQPNADLVTIKMAKKALDVAFKRLLSDPKFKERMTNIMEPYRDLEKHFPKDTQKYNNPSNM